MSFVYLLLIKNLKKSDHPLLIPYLVRRDGLLNQYGVFSGHNLAYTYNG